MLRTLRVVVSAWAVLLCLAAPLLQAQDPKSVLQRQAGRANPTEDIPSFNPVEVKEGRIIFSMYAPAAKAVELRGEVVTVSGKEYLPMIRDSRGVWSVTLSGLRAESYSYLYLVDGAPVVDQRNPAARVGPRGNSNRLEMPGSPEFYAAQDVPHGKVEINWYRSALLKETRPIWIYTPPGYSAGTTDRYPVLFLLHGSGDLEAGWTEDGYMNFILDNLIAAGKARPMIVVMPQGHVYRDHQIDREKSNEILEQVLIRDLLPLVNTRYRVVDDRGSRAIMGLSMGGGQALRFGLRHMDQFAYVIGLSPAVRYPDAEYARMFSALLADPKQSNALLKLLMIRCGTKDHLLDASDAFTKFLSARGIRHEYQRADYESLWPGRLDDHTWPIWRMDLRDVAPLLFR
jgi:enterochelin esterase family protein